MLTRKQQELLLFIHERMKESGIPPSFDEMKDALDISFRVQEQRLNAAQLAGKMDLSPSTLSRKLKQPEGDTQRFNCDDLEAYIRSTKDIGSVIAYLVAKYMESPEARQDRAIQRVEELAGQMNDALALLKGMKQ